MKKKVVLVVIVFVVALLAVCVITRFHAEEPVPAEAAPKRPAATIAAAKTPTEKVEKPSPAKKVGPRLHMTRRDVKRDPQKRDLGPELSAEEEKLRLAICEGMNNEDFAAVQKLYEQARKSDKVALRLALVDALGTFGKQSLPELTGLLADPSEEVVFEATAQWQSALYDIDDDKEKALYVSLAMKGLASEELLDDMCGELNQINNVDAIKAIVDVIENGQKPGVAAAKKAYETVTGEEWSDVAAAEKWLSENRNDE